LSTEHFAQSCEHKKENDDFLMHTFLHKLITNANTTASSDASSTQKYLNTLNEKISISRYFLKKFKAFLYSNLKICKLKLGKIPAS